MREMRDRGERVEIKYSFFFYNTATVQFYLWNCTVASIAKNLQYLPLPFFDVDDFKVLNAQFSLDMALAFFNANALTMLLSLWMNKILELSINLKNITKRRRRKKVI